MRGVGGLRCRLSAGEDDLVEVVAHLAGCVAALTTADILTLDSQKGCTRSGAALLRVWGVRRRVTVRPATTSLDRGRGPSRRSEMRLTVDPALSRERGVILQFLGPACYPLFFVQ
jgi:hypothetical protein